MNDLPISFQTLAANAGVLVLVTHALEWAKKSPLVPWLQMHTDGLTKIVAGCCAAASAVGMRAAFVTDGDLGTFTLTGIPATLGAAAQLGLHICANYGAIKAYYLNAVKSV